jgi:DNA-binding SARP family transcriptional activator
VGSDLEIRLLGPFLLTWKNEQVIDFHSARLQSVLAYLLLNRDAPVSRRQIAFEFWPDSSETQAFSNLRNLLTQLRCVLPNASSFLSTYEGTIQWQPNSSFLLDVDRFNKAAEECDYMQAVRLYEGDLLPNCYDDWITPERTHLRDIFSYAIEKLIRSREEARDYEDAIKYTKIYIQFDPLKESTYRNLMRLHSLNRERAEAVRVYQQCDHTLKNELGVEPEESTRKVYEQILRVSKRPEPTCGGKNNLPLVGRKKEWNTLLESWKTVEAGSPKMVILIGEAGIGKTRLLEEFRDWAFHQGISSAYARCYSTQEQLAYSPPLSWLRCPVFSQRLGKLDEVWLIEMARLLPEISIQFPHLPPPGPIKEGWQRVRLFEALTRSIFAAPQPLLLVLDDLHWADKETTAWLSYLLRFVPAAELMVLASLRPEETRAEEILAPLRIDLHHDELLIEFELDPFGKKDTARLANTIRGSSYSCTEEERIFIETEGNPLFILEMVQGQMGLNESAGKAGRTSLFSRSQNLTGKMEAVIGSRLSQLSGPAQALAALAATSGRQFDLQVLAKAWKSSQVELVTGLDELIQRRIVREIGEGCDFTHEKIREAIYNRLSHAHRRLLHRELAITLESLYTEDVDGVDGDIANHYIKARQERKALPYLLKAGQQAVRLYANQEGIHLLRKGVEILNTMKATDLEETETETIFLLLDLLGDVLEKTGDHHGARETYELIFRFCPQLDPILKAQTHRKIGQTWHDHQNFDCMLNSLDAAEKTLGIVYENHPSQSQPNCQQAWHREWLNIVMDRMSIYYYLDKPEKIEELFEQIKPMVKLYGTPKQRADFYSGLAGMVNRKEKFSGSELAIQYNRMALEATLETGEDGSIGKKFFNLGFSHLWAGKLQEAEELLLKSSAAGDKTGDEYLLSLSITYIGVLYRKMGRLDSTREFTHRSLELTKRGQRQMYTGMATANLAWLEWRAGNYQEAQRLGKSVLEMWEDISVVYPFKWAVYWPLIGVSLAEEDIHTAVEYVRNLLSPEQQPPPQPVLNRLNKCLDWFESENLESAEEYLKEAALLARDYGFL